MNEQVGVYLVQLAGGDWPARYVAQSISGRFSMQKWEYKTVLRERKPSIYAPWLPKADDFLAEFGNQGWELVAISTRGVTGTSDEEVWVFKRPKP